MDGNDIMVRLGAELADYPRRKKRLGQYIIDNCDRAAFMTADMLAASAGVSESSVVRFARQLGFDGYSDMRRALQGVLRERLSAPEEDLAGDLSECLRSAAGAAYKSSQSVLCRQNEKGFEPLLRAMLEAGQILIFGEGVLAGLALHLTLVLRALGLRAVELRGDEGGAGLLSAGMGDLLVCVSSALYSGRFSMLRAAKERGLVTALICEEELGAAAKYADHRIFARGDAAILCMIGAVLQALQKELGLSAEDALRETERKRREYLAYEYSEG